MAEAIVLYAGIESPQQAGSLRRHNNDHRIELRAFNRVESVDRARYIFELTVKPNQAKLIREEGETREYEVTGYQSAWLWRSPVGDPLSAGSR
jgi:hypothetical protein